MACGALATKTLADLEKPDARNLIRTELMTGFNNILGDSMVQDIFFTEFAIQ
jgi:flagellar basal body-associated protein FliL